MSTGALRAYARTFCLTSIAVREADRAGCSNRTGDEHGSVRERLDMLSARVERMTAKHKAAYLALSLEQARALAYLAPEIIVVTYGDIQTITAWRAVFMPDIAPRAGRDEFHCVHDRHWCDACIECSRTTI